MSDPPSDDSLVGARIDCSGTLTYPSQRQLVFGREMVATSQPLASEAGLAILRAGGSAVDAAIAAAATLTVTEPTTNGLGGDAFAIVWDGSKLHAVNGSGRSPSSFARASIKGDRMPTEGWLPITVPGQIALWADLHSRFGRLRFSQVLQPAVEIARDGFNVAPLTAQLWSRAAANYATRTNMEAWRATFLFDGAAPFAGQRVRLLDHARALAAIADSEGKDFYRGDLAARMERASLTAGGFLRASDLAAHTTEWGDTISIPYRGLRLHEIGGNNQGIAALVAVGILAHLDLAAADPDCADSVHASIEAVKLGFADAHAHVADSRFMKTDAATLLAPERLRALAARITPARAQDFCAQTPRPGGTVYLCTADARGQMVSLIQSNYTGFGSGVVIPETGIAMQNRGACFTLSSGHPNEAAPSKRPYHTIMPGFVTRTDPNGEVPAMAFGVMGGFMQPQGHVQVLTRMADHRQNPQSALDAPRWQWMRGLDVQLEPNWPESTIQSLRDRGHRITIAGERSVAFGRGQAILAVADGYAGASDLRADGCVCAR
jgi:gamma-glutamyltranspeptidase/glutathione hydrolase